MKKIFLLTALAVLLGVANAAAQQIAVVSENGETSVYQTFQAAIEGADPGSVIYLPGGSFSLPDAAKITKRLTIIGIGHRSDNDNVDGVTNITSNLWFNEGSSGSAIMGCYVAGSLNIGEGESAVNNILVRYCCLNKVQVLNSSCIGIQINQNYIKNDSYFSGSSTEITNNIIRSILDVSNGHITHNIVTNYEHQGGAHWDTWVCIRANNTTIRNNVIIPDKVADYTGATYDYYYHIFHGSGNIIYNNLMKIDLGEEPINIGDVDWNDVFVNYNNAVISPMSDFHFKQNYKQYENICGIYAGTGFNDHQTAPVPYIVAKRIADQTDAAGQLNIQVRVKAGN